MNKLKKFLLGILIICLILPIFAGCSKGNVLPKYQHKYVLVNYQSATCIQNEIFKYKCIGCNSEYSKLGQIVHGHKFNNYDVCIHCNEDKIVTEESEETAKKKKKKRDQEIIKNIVGQAFDPINVIEKDLY